jgi:hypothetical protein
MFFILFTPKSSDSMFSVHLNFPNFVLNYEFPYFQLYYLPCFNHVIRILLLILCFLTVFYLSYLFFFLCLFFRCWTRYRVIRGHRLITGYRLITEDLKPLWTCYFLYYCVVNFADIKCRTKYRAYFSACPSARQLSQNHYHIQDHILLSRSLTCLT